MSPNLVILRTRSVRRISCLAWRSFRGVYPELDLGLGMIMSLFFILSSFAHATCTVTDDRGTNIQLEKPAARIIALAPDITENLFAIGAGKKVIGVVSGSDYPANAINIPKV